MDVDDLNMVHFRDNIHLTNIRFELVVDFDDIDNSDGVVMIREFADDGQCRRDHLNYSHSFDLTVIEMFGDINATQLLQV